MEITAEMGLDLVVKDACGGRSFRPLLTCLPWAKQQRGVYFGQLSDTLFPSETPCLQNKYLNSTVSRDMACFSVWEAWWGKACRCICQGKRFPKQEGENGQDPPLAQGKGSASLIFPCAPHPWVPWVPLPLVLLDWSFLLRQPVCCLHDKWSVASNVGLLLLWDTILWKKLQVKSAARP